MNYDGRTQVGAPAQSRDLGSLVVTKLAVGPMDNNAYLLSAPDGSRMLIDAAAEPARILDLLGESDLDYVLTTHHHADHWGALAEVVAATGAETLAGAEESALIDVATDIALHDADTMTLGDAKLTFIRLRGHTDDSIAVHVRADDGSNHVFTGDSLFPGGVGRTTPATFTQLLNDVTAKLFDSYDDAWIYPGHGWDTTLAAERPHLPEWRERGW